MRDAQGADRRSPVSHRLPRLGSNRSIDARRRDERPFARDGGNAKFRSMQSRTADIRGIEDAGRGKALRSALKLADAVIATPAGRASRLPIRRELGRDFRPRPGRGVRLASLGLAHAIYLRSRAFRPPRRPGNRDFRSGNSAMILCRSSGVIRLQSVISSPVR